jgi:hypothetical protein
MLDGEGGYTGQIDAAAASLAAGVGQIQHYVEVLGVLR